MNTEYCHPDICNGSFSSLAFSRFLIKIMCPSLSMGRRREPYLAVGMKIDEISAVVSGLLIFHILTCNIK